MLRKFISYVCFLRSPEAAVLKSEATFNQTAPKVAYFSGRGPNSIAVDVLKVPNIYNLAPTIDLLVSDP